MLLPVRLARSSWSVKIDMNHVRDVMTPDPLVVRWDDDLAHCGQLFWKWGHRHLPVVDDDGRVIGLIVEADVLPLGKPDGQVMTFGPEVSLVKAEDVMRALIEPCGMDEETSVALQSLHDNPREAVVVVDADGLPVGIVTEHDLLMLAQWTIPSTWLVSDVSSTPVIWVPSSDPIVRAREVMDAMQIRHLVVMDGKTVRGILSWRDVVCVDPDLPIADLVRPGELYWAEGDWTLARAVHIMVGAKVGCLPILDEHREPEAVLTRSDIIRVVASL
jgi:CBS domain-containing protein